MYESWVLLASPARVMAQAIKKRDCNPIHFRDPAHVHRQIRGRVPMRAFLNAT
jgi:hypothetical protein